MLTQRPGSKEKDFQNKSRDIEIEDNQNELKQKMRWEKTVVIGL
jgi:hypothetical protein